MVPTTENTSDANEPMLAPCPTSGVAEAPEEAKKSPVIQLPDAEPELLMLLPKGVTNPHGIGPMLAEVNPLPPALVKPKPHSVPVVGGPAAAVAETVPARAADPPSRRYVTHSTDAPKIAFITVPLLPVQWAEAEATSVDPPMRHPSIPCFLIGQRQRGGHLQRGGRRHDWT